MLDSGAGATGNGTGVFTADAVDGSLNINTNKFTVDGANGNTAVAGTFSVTGKTTLKSDLTITGSETLVGTFGVGSYYKKKVKSRTATAAPFFNIGANENTPLYMKLYYFDPQEASHCYSIEYWVVTSVDGSASGTLTPYNPILLSTGGAATLGTAATLDHDNVFTPGFITGDTDSELRIVSIEVLGQVTSIS